MDTAPYKLWFDYLNASDRKRWSPKVRQYFEGVDGLPWDEWWERCRHLFIDDTVLLTVQEVTTKAELLDYWDDFRDDELGDSLCCWVELNSPKDKLLAAFSALLDKHHAGKRGRPTKPGTVAEFDLAGYVNVEALTKALDVHKHRGTGTLWEIGVACRVNLSQIPERGVPDADQRRVLASTVSRYMKRTEQLLSGVERGVFPVKGES